MDIDQPSLIAHSEAIEREQAAKTEAINQRCLLVERALRNLEISLDSSAGRIARLVARVAGHLPLEWTKQRIASDASVSCSLSSVGCAIRKLSSCRIFKRGIVQKAGNGESLAVSLEIDWRVVNAIVDRPPHERKITVPIGVPPIETESVNDAVNQPLSDGVSHPLNNGVNEGVNEGVSTPLNSTTPIRNNPDTQLHKTQDPNNNNSLGDVSTVAVTDDRVAVVVSLREELGVGLADEAVDEALARGATLDWIKSEIDVIKAMPSCDRPPPYVKRWIAKGSRPIADHKKLALPPGAKPFNRELIRTKIHKRVTAEMFGENLNQSNDALKARDERVDLELAAAEERHNALQRDPRFRGKKLI